MRLSLFFSFSFNSSNTREAKEHKCVHCFSLCGYLSVRTWKTTLIFFSSRFCLFFLPRYIFLRGWEVGLFLALTARVRVWCVLGWSWVTKEVQLGSGLSSRAFLVCVLPTWVLKTQVAVGPPRGHVWKWFQVMGNICCEFSSVSMILKLGWACLNTNCWAPPQSCRSSRTGRGTYSRKHTLRTPVSCLLEFTSICNLEPHSNSRMQSFLRKALTIQWKPCEPHT